MKFKKIDWIGILIFIITFVCALLICKIGFDINTAEAEAKYKIEFETENLKTEIKLQPEIKIEEIETISTNETNNLPVYSISDNDRWYIECVVAGEAQGESIEGKMAVAQCFLNAMQKDRLMPEEVKSIYGYCGWKEDLEIENPEMYEEVKLAVERVFDNGEVVIDKPILFFYAYKNTISHWHESLNHAITIGGHKFFYLNEDIEANWFVNMKENIENGCCNGW